MVSPAFWRYSGMALGVLAALSAGTSYVFPAYYTDIQQSLGYSDTEMAVISGVGNNGLYLAGVPLGMLIASFGPKPAALLAAGFVGMGYLMMSHSMEGTFGSVSFLLFTFFFAIVGVGSASLNLATLTTNTRNLPAHHTGLVTGATAALFGLSSLVFTQILTHLFAQPVLTPPPGWLPALGDSGGTPGFLQFCAFWVLGIGVAGGILFKFVGPPGSSNPLAGGISPSPGLAAGTGGSLLLLDDGSSGDLTDNEGDGDDEASLTGGGRAESAPLLVSHMLSSPEPEPDYLYCESSPSTTATIRSEGHASAMLKESRAAHFDSYCWTDQGGLRLGSLLQTVDFWLLFAIMCGAAGASLMYSTSMGRIIKLLVPDDSQRSGDLTHLNVSLHSAASCLGRLGSGILQDVLRTRHGVPRRRTLLLGPGLVLIEQATMLLLVPRMGPDWLALSTVVGGLGFGCLFAAVPAACCELFGQRRYAANWSAVCIGTAIGAQALSLVFGAVVDAGNNAGCSGFSCFRDAYLASAVCSALAFGLALWLFARRAHPDRAPASCTTEELGLL
ncbi:hypothetical protein H696_04977 [Fonticula alba]|uniref:Uncharacterized protein n=1 Tax=Fonticula alba TaxID=691883 RepID=A0A058Z316_FONAL|nr:hypothetical protein H696_04977 [Fonticula alba]KCV68689.1 hypothetical protein H696_04977 [Fonticula alba]|eukprot:XP_009497121.1 hypothetical protein H696_04977 [Fonticula alba]